MFYQSTLILPGAHVERRLELCARRCSVATSVLHECAREGGKQGADQGAVNYPKCLARAQCLGRANIVNLQKGGEQGAERRLGGVGGQSRAQQLFRLVQAALLKVQFSLH
jgi:hypothetical protein